MNKATVRIATSLWSRLAYACFVIAALGCSKSDKRSAGGACDAKSGANCIGAAELAAMTAEFEQKLDSEYKGERGADGNVAKLPGYKAGEVGSSTDGTLTADDIASNPDAELFTYTPPPETEAEYSEPQMVTASYLRLHAMALNCADLSYSESVPRAKTVAEATGVFITCIKITHIKIGKSYYIETPPIVVKGNPPSEEALAINGGVPFTSDANVSLSLQAENASEMYITNTADCADGGSWEAYAAAKSWSVASNASTTVYAKFRSPDGGESACASAAIMHDDTPPSAPTGFNDGLWAAGTSSPVMTWTASTDAGSGVASYQLAVNALADSVLSSNWVDIGDNSSFALSGLTFVSGQSYYGAIRAVDGAGNVSTSTIGDGFGYGLRQQAFIKAGNATAGDAFGFAVALSTDTMAVAAIDEDVGATTITNGSGVSSGTSQSSTGAVYVYKKSGLSWTQEAYLKAANADANDRYGHALALSGDTLVVTTPYEDSAGTTITNGSAASADNAAVSAGAAYVYRRSGSTWAAEAFLKGSNSEAGDLFGWSVAIDGDSIVIGARDEDSDTTDPTNNAAANAGAAYVFKRAANTWSEEAYLKAANSDASDNFGQAVAIASDTVAIAAPNEDGNATTITNGVSADGDNSNADAGAVYVFKRNAATWAQEAYVKAANNDADDFFGYDAVALSGETLVVGAIYESSDAPTIINGASASADNSLTNAGAAYVYKRTGTTWAQQAFLKASNNDSGDLYGWPVVIAGDVIAVGASMEDSIQTTVTLGSTSASSDDSETDSGAVYVYQRTGDNWSLGAFIKAPNGEAGDSFGLPLAISQDGVVVGNPYEDSADTTITNGHTASSDNSAADAGAVYFFAQ